jgi:putative DNA primase/helicase
LIVEGEKDADNLSKLGFTATCNPMGAKKWCDEYSKYLKGKRVVLIPDNDTEGREHMARVGASLKGKTTNLKLVELPGLPSKGDVSDFIESFGESDEAAERLSILIENAGPYEPPQKLTIDDVILPVGQFYHLEFAPRQELLFPWLKEDSINLVSGFRGCGKTWFALGVIDAVTRGGSFGPWECKNPVPCLFLDGEMTVQDDRERIEILQLNSDRKSPLYFYSDAYANQSGLPRAHLVNESWRQSIKRFLTTHRVKLWVLDNLASLAGGLDENSKRDWDPINSWLLELRFVGISTIMLHHVNKEGGQRGTSAREDNLDISIMLKTPHDYIPEDGARFVVHFSKHRIRTKYLNLIGDTEFKLIQDESDSYVWSYGNVKQQNKNEVLRMLDEGITYKEISQDLNISKGLITKIKKQAIKDGYISDRGKLTQDGFLHISGGAN